MTSAWKQWLADPSRTGTSPAEVVEAAVVAATGSAAATTERLLHGESNEVYDVSTEDGQRVVVRLSPRRPSLFPAERWAIEQSAAAGVPAPDVLLAALGLALLLPVLPFALEMLALRRMTYTAFGTLMALEPAFGLLIGLLVLHQAPSPTQILGIGIVVAAGAAAQRRGRRSPGAGSESAVQGDFLT